MLIGYFGSDSVEMKLLVFYPYVPWPLDRGTYHRTFHLLKALAERHEVDFLALTENGEGIPHSHIFEEFCRRVEIIPFTHPAWEKLFPKRLFNPLPPNVAHWTLSQVKQRLEAILAAQKYDAVHVVDIVLAQYFLQRHERIPLVIDRSRVDLLYQLAEHRRLNFSPGTKLLRCEGYAKLWFFERAMARRARFEIVCGPDDKTFVQRYVDRRAAIEVLVNGVDPAYFSPRASDEPRAAKPTILFCGAMDYNPNLDAMRWYFSEIHDALRKLVSDLEVLIVGKDPGTEIRSYARQPGVTVTGGVPDVRPFYRRAWLQIVPLRIGGGSRLKIVESLAMGTCVVSTTIGAQGLGLVHDSDILLADSASEFVAATARALRHRRRRRGAHRHGDHGASRPRARRAPTSTGALGSFRERTQSMKFWI